MSANGRQLVISCLILARPQRRQGCAATHKSALPLQNALRMQDQTLATSGLQSSFGFVVSPGANAATNGGWFPNWNSSADEVPSDGVRPFGPGERTYIVACTTIRLPVAASSGAQTAT